MTTNSFFDFLRVRQGYAQTYKTWKMRGYEGKKMRSLLTVPERKVPVHAKSEYLNPKTETNLKSECSNDQNKNIKIENELRL